MRRLNLPAPDDSSDSPSRSEEESDGEDGNAVGGQAMTERTRTAAGNSSR